MLSAINELNGLKIKSASLEKDGAVIVFEGDIFLSIYNPFHLTGAQSEKDLVDKSVIETSELPQKAEIKLEGDIFLSIDLRDESYAGPEAMQLAIPGKPIVVWN